MDSYQPPEVYGRVLAVAYLFPPVGGSGAIRNLKILKHLPEHGWRLRVLSVDPGDGAPAGQERLLAQIPADVEVIRTREIAIDRRLGSLRQSLSARFRGGAAHSQPEGERDQHRNGDGRSGGRRSAWRRLKDLVSNVTTIPDRRVGWFPFAVAAGIRAVRRERVDVIYAVGKPWTGFFVGYVLKVLFRKPLVIDFMDPWGASQWARSKGRLLDRVQSGLERFVVRRADFIIANTQTLADDFVERLSVPAQRVAVVTCGYDADDLRTGNAGRGDSCEAAEDGRFTISHTGTFYKQRNPVNFLKGVRRLIEEGEVDPARLRINFVGRMNVQDAELTELMNDPTLAVAIHREAWVPHERVMSYLRSSHLQLLVQPATRLQIPAKLYEYAAVGRPILALCDPGGAVDAMVREENWGESVDNDDIAGIARAIRRQYERFMSGAPVRSVNGASIEKYNVRNLAGRLAGVFEQVSAANRRTKVRELIAG